MQRRDVRPDRRNTRIQGKANRRLLAPIGVHHFRIQHQQQASRFLPLDMTRKILQALKTSKPCE